MITLIYPYYDNPQMLAHQFSLWGSYPAALKKKLKLIVVDDCSPTHPAADHWQDPGFPAALYRIKVDIPWNWLAARNLAAHQADTKWLLMSDIDHLAPADTLADCLAPLEGKYAYNFARVDAPDLKRTHPHPNSWLMTSALFHKLGGYDERFSGHYGSDSDFKYRLQDRTTIKQIDTPLIRIGREVIPDAATTRYKRKQIEDKRAVAGIKKARAQDRNWRPLNLTFPWERLL